MSTLSEYLRKRGLSLDPVEIESTEDPVLANGDLLKEVADVWTGHKNALTLVLQARISAIGRELLNKAVPEETVVLRQSLVEIGALISDFEKYVAESARRHKDQSEPKVAEPVPTEEGKEGSV